MSISDKDIMTAIEENDALTGIAAVEHVNSNYEYYLNASQKELLDMSKAECITAQHCLLRYSMSVYKKLNYFKGRYRANRIIFSRALIKVYGSYDKFTGSELITAAACNEYDHLREMEDELVKIDCVIRNMEGTVERVDKMVQLFKDLSFTKGRL